LHFSDHSILILIEELENLDRQQCKRLAYSFHYQQKDYALLFRYDNSPHFPRLATFPNHKHAGGAVLESDAPDLTDVLKEVDQLIYGR
jgi:hypothetical protein